MQDMQERHAPVRSELARRVLLAAGLTSQRRRGPVGQERADGRGQGPGVATQGTKGSRVG